MKAAALPGIRRVFSLGRPYAGRLGVALALSAVAVSVGLVLPMGLRTLLDSVLSGGDPSVVHVTSVLLLVLFAARAVVSMAATYLLRCTGERIVADLRVRVYGHLHALPVEFHDEQRTGDLTSRLTNDVAAVRAALTDAVVSSVNSALALAGALGIMLVLNWRMALLVVVAVPAVTLASRLFGPPLQRVSRETQERLGESTAAAEQALSGIRVVKAFGRAPFEVDRYRGTVEAVYDAARRRSLVGASMGAVVDLLFTVAVVALFWYGGMELLAGRMTPGDLVAFLFYGMGVSQGVAGLSQFYATMMSAAGASARIFALQDQPAEAVAAAGAAPAGAAAGAVSFQGVHFEYRPGHAVVRGVTFTAAPGERVALVGRSGAGKTTLFNLALRFYDPQQGSIRIDDQDTRDLPPAWVRDQMAVVGQEVHLFTGTVRENIAYGRLDATEADVYAAARAANADAFIRGLPDGYDTVVGRQGLKLSAGQRQRVAIARAVLKDAPILLLDEATSALDAESEALVQEALERLMAGRTTIAVAHRLATVRKAHRILVLDAGRVVAAGTHDALVAQGGLYARLAAFQFTAGPGAEPVRPLLAAS